MVSFRIVFVSWVLLGVLGHSYAWGQSSDEISTYQVQWEGLDRHPLQSTLRDQSRTFQLRNEPPASLRMLQNRMRQDLLNLQNVLHAEGYLLGKITGQTETSDDGTWRVVFQVSPGPHVRLASIRVETPTANRPRAQWEPTLRAGDPITAAQIRAEEGRILTFYQTVGHPFPKKMERDILLNPKTATVEIVLSIDPGPALRFGRLQTSGLKSVHERYIRRQRTWEDYDWYDLEDVKEFEKRLIQSRLFSQVRVSPQAGDAGDDGVIIRVDVMERHARSVRVGASHRSDIGFGANVTWEHRNIFGSGERLQTRLVAAEIEREIEIGLSFPGFLTRNQTLLWSGALHQEETDAYDSEGGTTFLGIHRAFTTKRGATVGVAFRYGSVTQGKQRDEYGLLMLPLQLSLDLSDNELHPTEGSRIAAEITPTTDLLNSNVSYGRFQLSGSTYWKIAERPELVLAGRATLGSLACATLAEVPADERYYAGGGGSVRGYVYQDIGPKVDDTPQGGLSLAQVSLEARMRQSETLGWVVFVDGGKIGTTANPFEAESIRWAAGVGLRLFTGFGPVRVDVAHPLNADESQEEEWQFYISIGQAF